MTIKVILGQCGCVLRAGTSVDGVPLPKDMQNKRFRDIYCRPSDSEWCERPEAYSQLNQDGHLVVAGFPEDTAVTVCCPVSGSVLDTCTVADSDQELVVELPENAVVDIIPPRPYKAVQLMKRSS